MNKRNVEMIIPPLYDRIITLLETDGLLDFKINSRKNLARGLCPVCGRREVYVNKSNPLYITCPRFLMCGWEQSSLERYKHCNVDVKNPLAKKTITIEIDEETLLLVKDTAEAKVKFFNITQDIFYLLDKTEYPALQRRLNAQSRQYSDITRQLSEKIITACKDAGQIIPQSN